MSQEISFTDHGHCIRGRIVHQSARSLVVEMLSPYTGLRNSTQSPIMGFRPQHDRLDGHQGYQQARGLLLTLLEVGDHVESNRETLRAALMVTQQHIREVTDRMMSDDRFLQARSILHRQRKEGLVDNREYQRALGVLRKQRDAWRFETGALLDVFFSKNFPMHVGEDSRDVIIDSLKTRQSLQREP